MKSRSVDLATSASPHPLALAVFLLGGKPVYVCVCGCVCVCVCVWCVCVCVCVCVFVVSWDVCRQIDSQLGEPLALIT